MLELYKLLGAKWTIPILHNIRKEPITYNEIKRLTNRMINPTILSQRLKDLARHKIIQKDFLMANSATS